MVRVLVEAGLLDRATFCRLVEKRTTAHAAEAFLLFNVAIVRPEPAVEAAGKVLRHLSPLGLALLDDVHSNLHAHLVLLGSEWLVLSCLTGFHGPLTLPDHVVVATVGRVPWLGETFLFRRMVQALDWLGLADDAGVRAHGPLDVSIFQITRRDGVVV